MEKISEKIRRSLVDALDKGAWLREIARKTNIDASQLLRFSRGEGRLGQAAIDSLGEYLGLTVSARKRRR